MLHPKRPHFSGSQVLSELLEDFCLLSQAFPFSFFLPLAPSASVVTVPGEQQHQVALNPQQAGLGIDHQLEHDGNRQHQIHPPKDKGQDGEEGHTEVHQVHQGGRHQDGETR